MNPTEQGPYLVQLTRLGSVNCYLVKEDDGVTIVDTAIPGSASGILAAARDTGLPVVRVTLTHGHGDHAGALDSLAERVPGAEILWGAREARLLRGDVSLDPGEAQHKPRGIKRLRTRPGRELEPGDRVGSLEVVAAPGHTPGQIAFLDTRDRTLIAGDAYATLGGTSVSSKVNRRCPFPGLGTWDRATALRSGRELRTLDPARLAVGHGPVLRSPLNAMDRALAQAS